MGQFAHCFACSECRAKRGKPNALPATYTFAISFFNSWTIPPSVQFVFFSSGATAENDLMSVLGDTSEKDADLPASNFATPRRVRPRPTKLLVCSCFMLSLAIEHSLPVSIFLPCAFASQVPAAKPRRIQISSTRRSSRIGQCTSHPVMRISRVMLSTFKCQWDRLSVLQLCKSCIWILLATRGHVPMGIADHQERLPHQEAR